MAERRTFEDFFDEELEDSSIGIHSLNDERKDEIKEAFELFINDTIIGQNVALQLKELKTNGVVFNVTTHNEKYAIQDEHAARTGYIIANEGNFRLISFYEPTLQEHQIAKKPQLVQEDLMSFESDTVRMFFHELAHVIYHINLERQETPKFHSDVLLHEFDAISFENAVMEELSAIDQKYANNKRNPVTYAHESKIIASEDKEWNRNLAEEMRTNIGAMILDERGIVGEHGITDENDTLLNKDTFLDRYPSKVQINGKPYTDYIRERKYTAINRGEDVAIWVERIHQDTEPAQITHKQR